MEIKFENLDLKNVKFFSGAPDIKLGIKDGFKTNIWEFTKTYNILQNINHGILELIIYMHEDGDIKHTIKINKTRTEKIVENLFGIPTRDKNGNFLYSVDICVQIKNLIDKEREKQERESYGN